MNKVIIGIILTCLILTGCETQTKTINNLEYVTHIKTRNDHVVQFVDKNERVFNLYVEENSVVVLNKGVKYNVTVTVENNFIYGDFIEDIQEVK